MYRIQTINTISEAGLSIMPTNTFAISGEEEHPHGILVRSQNLHEMDFPESLLTIGRAGAGVNNIPLERCTQQGIAVFNTPGGNANAVKELVIAALLLAARDVIGGIHWTRQCEKENVAKLVEKEKNRFAGTEIYGKKLGIIGLGAIGVLVANAATDLGMEVYGVDEYISVESAWNLRPSVKKVDTYKELAGCDYITLHLPLVEDTKGMINKELLDELKEGVVVLNFSRGELVNNQDIIEALASGQVKQYITDFPEDDLIDVEGVINIPHLGASTQESEENCARMAAREVMHYLVYGNITNSVNFPDCSLPYIGKTRLTILHQNVPKAISRFLDGISNLGLNIDNMINKSRGDIAYTIIDLDADLGQEVVDTIDALDEVIRVRLI